MNDEKQTVKHRSKIFSWILIGVILGLFLGLVFHLFWGMYRRNYLHPPFPKNFEKSLSAENIAGWMTFDFLSKAFHLPPGYLKEALSINSAKYPNLTVNDWAKSDKKSVAQVLSEVRSAIASFENPPADVVEN